MAKKNKASEPVKDPTAAPGWTLTFGDLMTQLLTFFILLFSVSEIKDDKIFDEIVKSFRTYIKRESPVTGYTDKTEEDQKAPNRESTRNAGNEGALGRVIAEIEKTLKNLFMQVPAGARKVERKSVVKPFEKSLKRSVSLSIRFRPGTDELIPGEKERLQLKAETLWGYQTELEIIGFKSPDEYKSDLAWKRATEIRRLLRIFWGDVRSGKGIKPEIQKEMLRITISTKITTEDPVGRVEIIDSGLD